MKRIVFFIVLLSLVFVLDAIAGCGDTGDDRIGDAAGELSGLLSGKRVSGSGGGGDAWNEVHLGIGNGRIYECAQGPEDPVDPSKEVGSWNIINGGQGGVDDMVCYTYDGSTVEYCFRVYENSGSYSFCDGTAEKATAQILSGGCPSP